MTERDIVLKEKLKFKGYCDLRSLYRHMYAWLKEEECTVVEEQYEEKIKGDVKELEIKWKATKKITDYFQIVVNIKMEVKNMKDVEVEIDGKRKSMNQLELNTELKGVLVTDYKNRWTGPSYGKFFKELYDKYIVPTRTERMEDETEKLVKDFKEEAKAFLELTGEYGKIGI